MWCQIKAGLRMHGTIRARPAEVFAVEEAGVLPTPIERYTPRDGPSRRSTVTITSRSPRRCTRSRASRVGETVTVR